MDELDQRDSEALFLYNQVTERIVLRISSLLFFLEAARETYGKRDV